MLVSVFVQESRRPQADFWNKRIASFVFLKPTQQTLSGGIREKDVSRYSNGDDAGYFEAEFERPVCRQVVAGPRNQQRLGVSGRRRR